MALMTDACFWYSPPWRDETLRKVCICVFCVCAVPRACPPSTFSLSLRTCEDKRVSRSERQARDAAACA